MISGVPQQYSRNVLYNPPVLRFALTAALSMVYTDPVAGTRNMTKHTTKMPRAQRSLTGSVKRPPSTFSLLVSHTLSLLRQPLQQYML